MRLLARVYKNRVASVHHQPVGTFVKKEWYNVSSNTSPFVLSRHATKEEAVEVADSYLIRKNRF